MPMACLGRSCFHRKQVFLKLLCYLLLLFNFFMRNIPSHYHISTIVYADDIPFFASDANIHELYVKFQSNINMLVA